MAYISKITAGGSTYSVGSNLYGTCDTAAGTAAKVAVVSGFDTLETGVTVHIKFTYSNTVASPTLAIKPTSSGTATTAKSIMRYGTTAPSTSAKTSWQAGSVVSFTYDGTYWQMNGWLNDDSTYTVNNGKLTVQKNGTDVATFTANQSGNSTANITVPTAVSELTNDSGYTTNTGTITGVKTTAGTHSTIDVSSGAANFNVPTKTSHLTNDSGFLTAHQTIKQDGVTGATVNRFGTCSTAAATAAKTVSITTGTFALEAGATIAVKFSNANTANSPTLAVNSTAAKNIFVNGAQITSGGNKALLKGTVVFIYDGTQWNLIGNYYDTNSGGTVTQVKVGSTAYNPSSGVVSLPAYPTTLPASDTVDTYDSTSGAPISGKGVADALATLPSPTGGTVTSVTIKGTSPIVSSSETAITTSGTRTISHANSGVTAGTYKSVTVNATGHVTAGTNPTTLSGYGITDANITDGIITLGNDVIMPLTSSSTLNAAKISGAIPEACYTDTKNTAGATDTSSKIFLIGATDQSLNPRTYSQDTAYVGTDGCLYSDGTKVLTSHQDISGKLNKSGGEITGTVYSQTNGANFEVYNPSLSHKMRFTATDTPRSGLYDMIASKWAFWKNADGEYQIGPNGYAVQARTQTKGTTKYPLRDGVVFAFRSSASSNTVTVACVSQWSEDSVVYQHHVTNINVTVDTWHETIKVANNTNGNIQVIMIGQFNDNSTY